ncbi:MAG TPA: acyltransferase family protein [Plasticicumulans sp.]|nr:acyltransferase family protein [Plasticicumulans sp.]
MKFRPDIEGLRAVAVMLVVAAHARIDFLAGGFIGVDVFFVLSGYLITGLLVQELTTHGRIDLPRFYARRFRRLFPSLLVVIAISSLLGQQLLAIGEQPGQALAAASAIVWLSNFYFSFSELDYFSAGAEGNLFLHTWSLGVEEQFYLIWPALLILLATAGRPDSGQANPGRLRRALPVITVLGLLVSIVWTALDPLPAYYLLPTRVWQFALGALVYLHFGGQTPPAVAPGLLRPASWLGLAAILAAALLFDGQSGYPGFLAALPSVGAAVVLASGAHLSRSGVGWLLSRAPMQAIGRVSYVWYLWHWPVLLLGAAVLDASRLEVRAGLALLALLLAALTHVLIEAPLRDARRHPLPVRAVLAGTMLTMFITSGLALNWHEDSLQEAGNAQQQPYEQARLDAPVIYAMGCDDWFHADTVKACEFGTGKAGKTAVVLGDSIGLQWFPAFESVFVPRDWRLLVLTKSSCPMVDEPIFYARIGRRYEECERWRANALQAIAQLHPDMVILGSTYTYDFSESQWREGTARLLTPLAAAAGRVYLLRSTPVLPFDAPSCLAPRGWLYQQIPDQDRCAAALRDPRHDDVDRWIRSAAAAFSNVKVVDMSDAVCPGGVCRAQQHGMVAFRDTQHLSAGFARSLSDDLARRLNPDAAGL